MRRVNPWEPPDELIRYGYSLFDICEQLHMAKTGSGDPLSDSTWSLYMSALHRRLNDWRDESPTATYDNAVKALIVATLKEQAE